MEIIKKKFSQGSSNKSTRKKSFLITTEKETKQKLSCTRELDKKKGRINFWGNIEKKKVI